MTSLLLLLTTILFGLAAIAYKRRRVSGPWEPSTILPGWMQMRAQVDDEHCVIRVLRPLPDKAAQRAYPQRLIFGLMYDEEGSRRLPDADEWKQIDAYAQRFIAGADHAGAISVASLTGDGLHQYVFYCRDPAVAHVRLMGALPDAEDEDTEEAIMPIWEITEERDANWRYVKRIARGP